MSKLRKTLIVSGVSLVILLMLAGLSLFINTPLKSEMTVEAGNCDLKQTDFYKNPDVYEFLLNHHIRKVHVYLGT